MLHTIQNEHLSVTADELGAELRSVVFDGTELLWQGDPNWWTGQAPILFPIIGRLNGDSYTQDGRQYTLRNHGFARRSSFSEIKKTDNAITFSLRANVDTKNVYPFDFQLLVTYTLSGSSLRTDFSITNQSDEDMFFSIGGHPAFQCPMSKDETFEDYEVVFNKMETAGNHIVTEDGFVLNETVPFFDQSNTIALQYDLFRQHETLVFSGLNSSVATLRSRKTGIGMIMDFTGFPYFALWTKPGAPFICMEPWQGVDDAPGAAGELREKTGIMRLAPGAEHICGFSLTPTKG